MKKIDLKSDKDLLTHIANGDEKAFNKLYYKYWDRIYNYLFSITKSNEITEELATDVFLRIWVKRGLLKEIKNINGYIFKIAHNKAMDFFKSVAQNKKYQEIIWGLSERLATSSADYSLLMKESQQVLEELIKELSPQRRLIFVRNRIDGLSQKEIAKELGLSTNTVKTTIANSKKSIKSSLKNKFPEGYLD